MNVLVIPEDFRKDQYILKPILEAMFGAIGQGNAKIRVCDDPLLGGVREALKWERIEQIIKRYRWKIDVFLLCVDRDGDENRKHALNRLEQLAAEILPLAKYFVAENAWQEIEVWVLAGHLDLPTEWNWAEIRAELDPKELYFLPFATQRDVLQGPGQGRKTLAQEAARRYPRIKQLCQEDIGNLETRIRIWLDNSP